MLRNQDFGYAKPMPQFSCVVTAQMNSDVVFDTHIVQSFFFLNQKYKPKTIFKAAQPNLWSETLKTGFLDSGSYIIYDKP